MVKKKFKKALTATDPVEAMESMAAEIHPEYPPPDKPPPPVEKSSKIDYHQPLESPYEGSTTTVLIGSQMFSIPDRICRQIPRFRGAHSMSSPIALSDISGDVAHTFVNFLYTGTYQTIDDPVAFDSSGIAEEYRKAILVYQAARIHELPDLESLAKHYIELFGEGVSMSDMLRTTRGVFSALPDDEDWLPTYIERSLQRQLKIEGSDSNLEELYQVLGKVHGFDLAVMKMVFRLQSAELQTAHESLTEANQLIEASKKTIADYATEAPPEACSEDLVEASMEELVEQPADAPPHGSPDNLKELVEASAEELMSEPIEASPEDSLEQAEELFEASVEEPADEPQGDPPPADVAMEQPVEETKGDPFQYHTIPQLQYTGWSFVQNYSPTAEGDASQFHSPSNEPAARNPFTPEKPLFEYQIEPEPAPLNLSTVSETHRELYADWGNLSSKMIRKRVKILKAKRLPIPDEDGFVRVQVG
ncbi:hypothetical protein PMG11_11058 [Penicillium brasilianum]|uniref:BTB domain-containing protein n=1 Tax=Penicillium brasilianum TaxID=104259 RepID=A0A0F7U2S8_PENBI|nr:hypothetical protein PMG11_11058 [Penicillium brasilianum]